jgi:sirohydrochlorin ferrochelatase
MPEHYEMSETGIIVVDHGSRREASNRMLVDLTEMFKAVSPHEIVEPAHMELAAPSLETAFRRCVQQGARLVVVHPYFLLPGKHWEEDITRLAAEAARHHPGVQYLITAPIGLHSHMTQVIGDRVRQCLDRAVRDGDGCDFCATTDRCDLRPHPPMPEE